MEGDILRAAQQMQAQQAALAQLRVHYAGLAMAELLASLCRSIERASEQRPIDAAGLAANAVRLADAMIAALGRPPAAS